MKLLYFIKARLSGMLCCILISVISVTFAQMRHVKYYNIDENFAIGTHIGNLITDVNLESEYDPTQLDELQFRILSSSRVNITLLDNTGQLVVSGPIDREFLCPTVTPCEVDIDIYVSLENVADFNIIKVTFSINDVNDNAPRFGQRVFFKPLLETTSTGTLVSLPYAEDKDSAINGVQRYELVPASEFFSLQMKNNADGSEDVLMRLDKPLDYERQKHINFTLIAYDGGDPPLSGSMEIVIAVSDANDHIPAFANSSYEVSIAENIVIGSTVLRVEAIDADSGINSMITYDFSQRTRDLYGGYFLIDAATGDIVVRGVIDYETHTSFHLSVVGHDNGPNSHSVDTTVIIRITDQNDCRPQIDINTLNDDSTQIGVSKIQEGSPVGTFVALVAVSDEDSGIYGAVSCQLVSSFFSLDNIDNHEYQIVTKVIFDREERSLYEIILTCEDGGSNPNLSEQRIQVRIIDVNDHAPVFSQNRYVEEITEMMYQYHTVMQISATDDDFGEYAMIRYSLDPSVSDYFRVDPQSGLIQTLQQFDREAREQYIFQATAIDGGNLSTTADIIINIKDKNDEKPVFTQRLYFFNVSESEPANTIVGTVSATDRDGEGFNEISYSIDQGVPFSIDTAYGIIKTVRSLDREERDNYSFTVQATDTKFTTPVTVRIKVLDKNDNAPTFIFPSRSNHTVQIPTQLPLGYSITRISARDPDDGPNATITYSASGGEGNFDVGNNSGIVRTVKDLELADKETFLLRIHANDSGIPQRYTVTSLTIVVNKSLAIGLTSNSSEKSYIIGTNLNIVIIVSAALACVILILILSIMCIYCRKKPYERKHECEYDQCQMRDDTMETFQDGQFDTLPRPQIGGVKEYTGPTLHGFTVDSPYTMDDSGLQIDDMMYHQKPANSKQAMESQGNVYSSNFIPQGTPTRIRETTSDAKKVDVKAFKREVDQDSTYSGDGSNPDSGKGPSEEGDNSAILHAQGLPPVLPPVLEEEHRSCDVTSACQNGTQACCAASNSRAQYGFMPNSQPYITGIAMCTCKSCHSHHRNSGHYGTMARHKDNMGHGYDARTNSLPRSSHSIDKVPRLPPRVPIRADTTRSSGAVGVSPFGSCRDVEIPQKTVTFKNDHEPQTHYYQNQSSFTDNYRKQSQNPNSHYQVPRSINPNNIAKGYQSHNQIGKPQSLHNHVTNQLTFNNNKTGSQLNSDRMLSDAKRVSYEGEEVDLNSSTTSGSYVVDHLDMSDVINDSHWNIRDSVV